MSFTFKRRLVLVCLIGFAIWPLLHRVLVARYEVSPWRLGGWAMYCTPKLEVEVAIVPEIAGQPVERELSESLRDQATRFAQHRAELGRFVDSRSLAAAAMVELDIDQVVITIQRQRLDPVTDHIVGSREYFRYRANGSDGLSGGKFAQRELP